MSYRSDIVYVYDGSFEGVLSVIFDAFSRMEVPDTIFTYDNEVMTLFDVHDVETDENKAKRVAKWLRSISGECFSLMYNAFLTCAEEKERYMLLLAIEIHKRGKDAVFDVSNPAVHILRKAVTHLKYESEHYKGFVRFTEISGVLVAEIQPKNIILPTILKHFEVRFPNEQYMIIDRTHKSILLHHAKGSEIFPYTEFELSPDSPSETAVKNLWRGFYDTVAIEARKNYRCRMGHMPKRYWACMTEMTAASDIQVQKAVTEDKTAKLT